VSKTQTPGQEEEEKTKSVPRKSGQLANILLDAGVHRACEACKKRRVGLALATRAPWLWLFWNRY
jgi:hypothetical protein